MVSLSYCVSIQTVWQTAMAMQVSPLGVFILIKADVMAMADPVVTTDTVYVGAQTMSQWVDTYAAHSCWICCLK